MYAEGEAVVVSGDGRARFDRGTLSIEAREDRRRKFPTGADPDRVVRQFNTGMTRRYERILDFLEAASITPSLLAAHLDREHESFAVADRVAATRSLAAPPPRRELLERVYQAGFSVADNGRIPGAARS